MKQLKKVSFFGFIIILLIFLNGCGLLKNITRTKDKTKIVTEFFIDTNIVIHYDTVSVFDTVPVYDTAIVENKTSIAKSYFSPGLNKIVLELKGKEFNVPVKLHKKETKTETKKQTESKPDLLVIGLALIIFFIFLFLVIKSLIN